MRTVNTKKRRPHADLEGTTRGSLEERSEKTSRVLKTFFSRAFEEGVFFARREEEEEEEEEEGVHSFVRVIFFFSQRGVQKKGVAFC